MRTRPNTPRIGRRRKIRSRKRVRKTRGGNPKTLAAAKARNRVRRRRKKRRG